MNAPMLIATPTRRLVVPPVVRNSTRPAMPTKIDTPTVNRTVLGGSGWGPINFVKRGRISQKMPPHTTPA